MLTLMNRCPEIIDPDVREVPGLEDIAIDGWVPMIRKTRVKLVGFMKRGEQPNRIYEPVVVIHLPMGGCEKSIVSTARALARTRIWAN